MKSKPHKLYFHFFQKGPAFRRAFYLHRQEKPRLRRLRGSCQQYSLVKLLLSFAIND